MRKTHLLLLITLALGVSVLAGCGSSAEGEEETTVSASSPEEETEAATALAYPEVEDSASLSLSSVYTSSILNPDCGGDYAQEVASLEVSNLSEHYLLSATLLAVMSDGTEVTFVLADLPAGARAQVFDVANQSLSDGVSCVSLSAVSEEYLDGDVLMSDAVAIAYSGADAILTNVSDETLTNLAVVYHCNMDGDYYGGVSYTVTVESLEAGASYTLSDDALMGEVAVVRISAQ